MKRPALALGAILTVTLAAYAPSLGNGLTNWDDDKYVVNQPGIRTLSAEAVTRHFTTVVEGNYHPLTMLSLSADYAIGGLEPAVYHATNVALHLVNTGLVFALAWLFVRGGLAEPDRSRAPAIAAVTALVFGVHTMHVESVAWVAERKDVLYAAFFFSSLIAYVRYVERRSAVAYALAILLFLGSLLSKAMAVPLAVTLFAVDYLFKRRMSVAGVVEKLPFLALAVVFGVVAMEAQQSQGAVIAQGFLQFHERVIVASAGLVHHLAHLVLPIDLSPFYAYPARPAGHLPPSYWWYPVLVAALVAAVIVAGRRSRLAVFAAAFFVLNVALVLQFFPVGSARVADRYVYVASAGPMLLAAVGYDRVARHRAFRTVTTMLLGAYVVFLGVSTWRYSSTWKDSVTLWNVVISDAPLSPLPYYNRGSALLELKDYPGAMRDLSKAVELNPRYAEAYHNRGVARRATGDLPSALSDFNAALAINPRYKDALLNAGNLMVTMGDYPGASRRFTELVALGGEPAAMLDLHVKRAISRYLAGDYRDAIDDAIAVGAEDAARARALFPGFAEIDASRNRAACPGWLEAASRAALAREYADQYCR